MVATGAAACKILSISGATPDAELSGPTTGEYADGRGLASEELYTEIGRPTEEDFVNEDEALEELLSAGIDVYATEFDEPSEPDVAEDYAENMWDAAEDPASGDDYGA